MNAKPTFLLVDDCQDTLMMLRFLFEGAGANVYTAASGQEALSIMERSGRSSELPKFTTVLLDIRMPTMEGTELARKIREQGFSGKIFALTANATGHGREQSIQSGIDTYLGKNTIKKELAEAIVQEQAALLPKH